VGQAYSFEVGPAFNRKEASNKELKTIKMRNDEWKMVNDSLAKEITVT